MSVFILKCKDCGHIFYDIVVLCTGQKVEDVCPVCNSKNIDQKKMDKPKNKDWAEDEGCHHGNPNDFVKGKSTQHSAACSADNTACDCSEYSDDRTIDEEIDIRIAKNKNDFKSLKLPNSLKEEFKKPWGEILKDVPIIEKSSPIITVGDITTKNLLKKFYVPNLAIIDNIVKRKPLKEKDKVKHSFFDRKLFFPNPRSLITKRLYQSVERIQFNDLNSHTLIEIDGEEDLAVIVCILHAPIGSHVFYGQPDEGLVHIKLNKKNKYKAEDLYNQFEEV